MVELFPAMSSTESRTIDLVATLEHKQQNNRWQSREQILCGCHWFQSDVSSNSSECRHKIVQILSKSCAVAGFSLISGKVVQTPNKNGLIPLRLTCNRSRQFPKNKKSKQLRRTETSRPKCSSEKCPFAFTVYYDQSSSRWLLPGIQQGCSIHKNHPQLDTLCSPIRKSVVDLDELEMVFQQLKMNINPSLVAKLFAERTGTSLSSAQLRKFRQIGQELSVDGEVQSPADKLLRHLNSDPSIHYVALTASTSLNKLVTIRQSRRSRGQSLTTDFKNDDDLGDDSVHSFAETILNSLTVTSTQKLLLCVAWTTDDAQLLFQRFPHCFGTDVTNGTNQEK